MERLTKLALGRPRQTIALVLALTAFAAVGLTRSTVQVGYRNFLGSDHPAIVELDRLIERFGGGLPILIVWSCEHSPCESALDESSLQMALEIGRQLEQLPIVRRVGSPANTPVPVALPDGVGFRRFFEGDRLIEDRDALAARAVEDPLWVGNVVSADGVIGAITVQLAFTDSDTTAAIVPAVLAALRPYEAAGFEFHLVGDPVDFVVAGGELQEETPRIIPIMVVLVALVVFGLLRSAIAVVLALSTSGIAVLWTLGLMGWLSWPQMELTQALPPLILVIGLCDAVHVLSRYSRIDAPTAHDRTALMLSAVADVGPACLITSLTTAAGFLSFATSGVESFLRFGTISAFGVLAALALTFTALPIALARLAPARLRVDRQRAQWDAALSRIVSMANRRGVLVIAAASVLLVLAAVGASRLRVDVDEQEMVGANSKIVQWAAFVEDHFRKVDSLELELVLPPDRSITEPEAIRVVGSVEAYLESIRGLGNSISLLDFLGPLHQALHDDDPAFNVPADTQAGNAELLLTLQMDANARIDDWVSLDERRTRLSVEADPLSRTERFALLGQVSEHLAAALPEGWTFTLTGPLVVYAAFVDEIQRTQLQSFATAFLAVSLMLFLFLWITGSTVGSATLWTLAGVFSTGLPVLATLGAMGALGIPLDPGSAMVAAIVLGIGIDDTIHLISAYRMARARGEKPELAIASGVRDVGQALVTTSIALSVGFFALLISPWQTIASFGLLSGVAILAALLADLLLLPALVTRLSRSPMVPPEPPEVAGTPRASTRTTLSLFVPIGVAGALLFAILDPHPPSHDRLACRILENGTVAVADVLSESCPIRLGDHVRSIDVDGRSARPADFATQQLTLEPGSLVRAVVVRGGVRTTVDVPAILEPRSAGSRAGLAALIAFALTGVGAFLLWSSAAPAAVPFSVVCGCLAVLLAGSVVGHSSVYSMLPYVIGASILPFAIAHLALLFPHQRAVAARAPGIPVVLYGAAAGLATISAWSFLQRPGLWWSVGPLPLWLAGTAWGVLQLSLLLDVRGSPRGLQKSRATSALLGTAVVAAAFGSASALDLGDPAARMAMGLAALPVPFGVAIARFQFFDVRPYLARAAALAAWVAAYAIFVTALWSASDSDLIRSILPSTGARIGAIIVALLVVEVVRAQLRRIAAIVLPSQSERLDELERDAVQELRQITGETDALEVIARSLWDGLTASGVAVLLPTQPGWRLAAARGSPHLSMDDLDDEVDFVASLDSALHLGPEGGGRGRQADGLRARGVAVAAPVKSDEHCLAMVLVESSRNRLPYSREQIHFVDRLCRELANSLREATQIERLIRLEHYSTLGRLATGLMHDVGKPVAIIRQRARKAAGVTVYPADARNLMRSMAELAGDALETIDRLMYQAREGIRGSRETEPIADVVSRAVEGCERIHTDRDICVRLAPGLPSVSCGSDIRVALTGILENALRASHKDEVTDVVVRHDGVALVLEVIDRGCGMSPAVLESAFEPFFTTRREDGGRGVGLSASRTLVERLGGSLTLESQLGAGTCATIRIPIAHDGRSG